MKIIKPTNILKQLAIILIFSIVLTTFGCSSDDSDSNEESNIVCDQLIDLSTSYSNAFSAFQTNPSENTCNDLRSAALNFIDSVENCSALSEQYSDLEEAAQGWTELNCSQEFD